MKKGERARARERDRQKNIRDARIKGKFMNKLICHIKYCMRVTSLHVSEFKPVQH